MKHGKIANEKTALKPLSSYSKSKVSIEKFLLKYKNKTKTIVTILRFATAFGLSSRMRFDLTINEFVKNIFFKKKFNVYDLNTWRPYCHVKDFARAIYTVISSKFNKINFEIFNVGSNKNNYTKKEIISKIAKYVQSNKIKYLGTGQDKRNYQVDFSKLSKKLNFKTLYSVDYGIKEIIGWLSKNKNKKFNKMGNYIINEKNL
jgi:nucleoside-diphosphate-sugar epimerase